MKEFLLALGLSVLLYNIGSPLILSLISIPSFVLWGMALIPVWFIAYKEIKKRANEALKVQLNTIHLTIDKIGIFLEKKWPLQIDVKKDNINALAQKAVRYIQTLEEALAQCRHRPKSWKEHAWVLDKTLQISRLNMITQLEAQKSSIQSKLTILVDSVPQQIEAMILQLKPDFRNSAEFVPELEAGKLEQLTDFVNHYGSEETKKAFASNTNLINLFVHALELKDLQHAKFISKKSKPSPVGAPWGGYIRLEAQFKGWRHLMNGWMIKGERKEALLSLLSLLEGTLTLTSEELEKNLNIIENDQLSSSVRSHLFLWLDKTDYIPLLKITDQKQLETWYESHKAAILKAQETMEAIFKDPAKPIPHLPELAQYFELLDNAILISSIQSEHVFRNLIRNYFEQYQGDHPFAHLFLRFVPEESSERIEYTQKAQIKRVEWFIEKTHSQGAPPPIAQAETSLFNDRHINPNIASTPCEFIALTIKSHPAYSAPYSPAFQQFLNTFSNHAFCNTDVKVQYMKNHRVGVACV